MQDGSRQRYDPITLPSEVYLNKSKLFTKGISEIVIRNISYGIKDCEKWLVSIKDLRKKTNSNR